MAKKITKSWKKKFFGNSWNIWSLVLLGLILASGWWIWMKGGMTAIWDQLASAIFYMAVIGFGLSFLIRKSTGKKKKKRI